MGYWVPSSSSQKLSDVIIERCKILRKWSNMWSSAKNGLVQPSKQGRTSPLIILRKREISQRSAKKAKEKTGQSVESDTSPFFGLSDKTWTCGLYYPKVARYQLRHTQMPYNLDKIDAENLRKWSARPAGLNTPSHSRCASLDALAPTTSCFGLLHRKNDNQSFFLANYQLRHNQKYKVLSLRAIIL